ncbi:MAG TPA: endo-1,4-beta-xylanase [Candidatus Limnocylindrales bacterium]
MSLDARIKQNRTADATVTILGDGAPLANEEVTVGQVRHKFLFGNIGFEFLKLANNEVEGAERERLELLADEWLELFNFSTLPFYWGRFEKERGKPDTARLLAGARWFAERGVPMKGHPLCWHTSQPDWLLPLSNEEILQTQKARIAREVTDFRGLIDTWDAINEAVIMPVFENGENGITRVCRANGRIATVRMSFEMARASNPNAYLLLNDFNMSTAFECLIEGVLETGLKVDAIGLQSHMHQGYWGEEWTLKTIDRFARYGLPIHFTESSLVSGELMPPEIEDLNDYKNADWASTPEGEDRQADEMVRHYKTLLSHPAVEASTYWGIADGGWLDAPSGFVHKDGSHKPAYDAMHSLVKGEWWLAPTKMATDAQGRLRFNGFLGDYEVTVGDRKAGFALAAAGEAAVEVKLG